ncbi:MAG: hypothetical protein K8U57_17545 [Planctomycetes bacterium]|nr:hypothetical protein [Planctomycetota bacterium]
MTHRPQLRKKTIGKSVYWFTKARGDTRLGSADELRLAHRAANIFGRTG